MADWENRLSEYERQLLANVRRYTQNEPAGLPGHKLMLLIEEMAKLLDGAGGSTPLEALQVPYVSQWQEGAMETSSDCGPACVKMVGEYWRPDLLDTFSVDHIMNEITHGVNRGTTLTELITVTADLYDVELVRHNASSWLALERWVRGERRPVIALVHYGANDFRMDRNYTTGHYEVVVWFDEVTYQGEVVPRVVLHDPNIWGKAMGSGFLPFSKPHFMAMWEECYKDGNPKRSCLVSYYNE